MNFTIQNIPFLCLFWIGIGFVFIMLGIFMMASHNESSNHYIEFADNKQGKNSNKEVEELFSYFLEEEEKKNQGLREMLTGAIRENDLEKARRYSSNIKADDKNTMHSTDKAHHESPLNDIIKLHEEGLGAEEIAKKLKKGVGEVNLMISLYSMR